ncbi:MAG: hypothetical protein ACKVJI_08395 [Pseudomonadales bacterium]
MSFNCDQERPPGSKLRVTIRSPCRFNILPDRGEPIGGEIDYRSLISQVQQLGDDGAFGAEYTPRTNIDEGLYWLLQSRTKV